MKFTKSWAAAAGLVVLTGVAQAVPVINPGLWPQIGSFVAVNDPLDPTNGVAYATLKGAGGDLKSGNFTLTASSTYRLSFDYLGTQLSANGYVAITNNWLFGADGGEGSLLLNDGAWHHYSVEFLGSRFPNAQIYVEDFGNAGPGTGAYFDNFSFFNVTSNTSLLFDDFGAPQGGNVPEPTSLALVMLGLLSVGATRWRGGRFRSPPSRSH